jgi:ribosomal protein L40E
VFKPRRRDVKGCPYCPAVLPLRATVCDRCGRDLTRAPTREAPGRFAGRRGWVILLVLLIAIVVLAIVRSTTS